jgi:hypothetical protein
MQRRDASLTLTQSLPEVGRSRAVVPGPLAVRSAELDERQLQRLGNVVPGDLLGSFGITGAERPGKDAMGVAGTADFLVAIGGRYPVVEVELPAPLHLKC